MVQSPDQIIDSIRQLERHYLARCEALEQLMEASRQQNANLVQQLEQKEHACTERMAAYEARIEGLRFGVEEQGAQLDRLLGRNEFLEDLLPEMVSFAVRTAFERARDPFAGPNVEGRIATTIAEVMRGRGDIEAQTLQRKGAH